MKGFKSVDNYILKAPPEVQGKLSELRATIFSVVPGASEGISYGMPYYSYKGKLVYFLAAKSHIGFYIPPPVIENFKEELKNYKTAKATIRFPLDQKLPITLIKKLIKARVRLNKETFKK